MRTQGRSGTNVSRGGRHADPLEDAHLENFRVLAEQLPVVTYRYALDGLTAIYMSPQIHELVGYPSAGWIADPTLWERLIHPEDRSAVVAENDRTTASGDPYVMEYRLVRRDGTVAWVHDEARLVTDEDGAPRFWQGVMVDVTERRAVEQARQRAEATYRSLVERLPAVTYTVGDPQLPVDATQDYVSPQIVDLLGCTPEEWLRDATAWRAFVHPDDLDRVVSAWYEASRHGAPFEMEYRLVARDGLGVWVRDQAALVRDETGRAHLWQGVMTDVTEQRAAQEALEAAFGREREVSARLRAIDEMKNTFLAAVSHELRTPLSAILGLALTLEREELELGPEDSRELLRRLASNARKLNRLLADLLDLDRLGRGIVEPRRRPTDLAALVRHVVENADAMDLHPPRLDLEPLIANIDGPKVERIVENLVANAARHTPVGTSIWIRVHHADGGVMISVDDEGPGIPADQRLAIFEPFRQVPGRASHAPGVGIGLSLVARFSELHGGRAWVEPRAGGGSSFKVLLPDAEPEAAAASA
jgi:PAS domain S-box-containing protein